jgi:hypothetical protein
MNSGERQERLKLFLILAEQLPTAKETIDNVFRIVSKYDLPKHVDREFIYDCLIQYYQSFEEYEKCAELLKFKLDTTRKKKITVSKLTREDLRDLRTLGFKVPDEVKLKALAKFASLANKKKDS